MFHVSAKPVFHLCLTPPTLLSLSLSHSLSLLFAVRLVHSALERTKNAIIFKNEVFFKLGEKQLKDKGTAAP